jgi:hypothetical protein
VKHDFEHRVAPIEKGPQVIAIEVLISAQHGPQNFWPERIIRRAVSFFAV